jgi:ubiquinone/menaquinone biosynthesis C-methylase UbiE
VTCGAGFLTCAFVHTAQWVYGIDLSRRLVLELHTLARMPGYHNTIFCQADAEALPFGNDLCDLLTSTLAFQYFPIRKLP